MWTINKCLQNKYIETITDIKDGLPIVEGVRVYKNDTDTDTDKTVRIETVKSNASEKTFPLVLQNREDRILVNSKDKLLIYDIIVETFEHYNQWERKLLFCLLEKKPLQELLDCTHEIFQRPMFIKSTSSWVYAMTDGYESDTFPNWSIMRESIVNRDSDFSLVLAVSTDKYFKSVFLEKNPVVMAIPETDIQVIHANIWIDSNRVCEIVEIEEPDNPFDSGDIHLVNCFVSYVQKHINENKLFYLSHSGLPILLKDIIKDGSDNGDRINVILKTMNWSSDDEFAIFCVKSRHAEHETPIINVLLEKLIKNYKFSCVFLYDNIIVGISNITKQINYQNAISKLKSIIPEESFMCAISYEFVDLRNFAAYFRQANSLLQYVQMGKIPFLTMHMIASVRVKDMLYSIPDIETLIHPDIKRLLLADKEYNSQNLTTLFEYLVCGGNYTDTANRLGLHRNSLIYRINRIKSIIRCNLDDPETRKLLFFSCLLSDFGNNSFVALLPKP